MLLEKNRETYIHMCVYISSKHKENAKDVRDLWYYMWKLVGKWQPIVQRAVEVCAPEKIRQRWSLKVGGSLQGDPWWPLVIVLYRISLKCLVCPTDILRGRWSINTTTDSKHSLELSLRGDQTRQDPWTLFLQHSPFTSVSDPRHTWAHLLRRWWWVVKVDDVIRWDMPGKAPGRVQSFLNSL